MRLGEPALQVEGGDGPRAAGDLAAVPDLTADESGVTTAPNAPHAVRRARRLADDLVAGRHRHARPAARVAGADASQEEDATAWPRRG